MTGIPRALVNGRRTAGALLLVSSLTVLAALAYGIVWYVNKPPTVNRLASITNGIAISGEVTTTTSAVHPSSSSHVVPPPSSKKSPTHTVPPGSSSQFVAPPSSKKSPTRAPVDPLDQLKTQAAADHDIVAAIPDGWWVPQLSSGTAGMVADNKILDNQMLLHVHDDLRAAYPGVALLWSGGFRSYTLTNYWVTIVAGSATASSDDALAWCRRAGLDDNHCYAHRISVTGGYDPNAVHNK